jgi:hypothetical protein
MTVESWRVAPPGRGRVRGAHARARTSPGAEPTESAPGQRGVSKGRYRREHVRSRTGQIKPNRHTRDRFHASCHAEGRGSSPIIRSSLSLRKPRITRVLLSRRRNPHGKKWQGARDLVLAPEARNPSPASGPHSGGRWDIRCRRSADLPGRTVAGSTLTDLQRDPGSFDGLDAGR